MSPTLLSGDKVLVLRHWPNRYLQKGQVIVGDLRKVFDIPADQDLDFIMPVSHPRAIAPEKFIKRLIGLPGDTVVIPRSEIADDFQYEYGQELDVEGNLVWQIPPGFCFVRGDGKASVDSISWGPIPLNYLRGIVLFKLPVKSTVFPIRS